MNKVVLISGGSDGLGKTIAENLARDCKVIILSPSEEKLKKVASEIGVDFSVADVSDFEKLDAEVKKIIAKYGRIDCLINNAGLWIEGDLDQNEPNLIKKVLEVNLLGVIFLTKAVIAQMKKQGEGLIVNVSSQAGLYGKAERGPDSATKWGVTGFTKSMQPELAKYGISVTGVYPAKMNTKMFEKAGFQKDLNDAIEPEEVSRVIRFLLETNKNVNFPEIGIKSLSY